MAHGHLRIAFALPKSQIAPEHEMWGHHYPGMKFFSNFRLGALLALLLASGGFRAAAAPTPYFTLSATTSTNLYFAGVTITNTITVTNQTGLTLTNLYLTNSYSSAVSYQSVGLYVDNTYRTNYTALTNDTTVTLSFQLFTNNSVAQFSFTWQPLTYGLLTNTMVVATSDLTNTAVLTVTNPVYSSQADLAVGLSLISQACITNQHWVITNDWVNYRAYVTNLGPGAVNNLPLLGNLPAGVKLISINNAPFTGTNANVFSLFTGTLAAGASTNFPFTVAPATNGYFPLKTFVSLASGVYDSNPLNNQATNVLLATNYLAGTLSVVTNSGQIVNPQNGLIEQTLNVVNPGATPIQAVRVVVTGLTNQLYNASATNGRQPFVVYPLALPAGGNVALRLQFSPRLPFPLTNGQLLAYEVPATVLNDTPPPVQVSTNFGYYLLTKLAGSGDMLLEFTNLGGTYTVIYADNPQFNHARISPPAVKSGANRIQWLDYGPPATISFPTGTRYYRVILNP